MRLGDSEINCCPLQERGTCPRANGALPARGGGRWRTSRVVVSSIASMLRLFLDFVHFRRPPCVRPGKPSKHALDGFGHAEPGHRRHLAHTALTPTSSVWRRETQGQAVLCDITPRYDIVRAHGIFHPCRDGAPHSARRGGVHRRSQWTTTGRPTFFLPRP